MNENNFDDIKKYFEPNFEVPENLSKENIVKMLEDKKPKQKKKKHILRKAVAAAAALAIITTATVRISNIKVPVNYNPLTTSQNESNEYETIDLGLSKNELSTFKSEEDLKNYFLNIAKKKSDEKLSSIYDVPKNMISAKEMDESMADNSSAFADDGLSASIEYSTTNVQTNGVDEADVVKNDGRYIYVLSQSKKLTIIDTKDMSVVFSKVLEAQDKEKIFCVTSFYIKENRLVATGYEYFKSEDRNILYASDSLTVEDGVYSISYDGQMAVSAVYDISDKSNPSLLRYVTQDGFVSQTRMIGNVLYTVSEYTVNTDSKKETQENYSPKVNGEAMTYDEIYVLSDDESVSSYIVVTGFNIFENEGEVAKTTVLGRCDYIYCSLNNLYAVSLCYEDKDNGGYKKVTNIYSFSLSEKEIAYKASGVISGFAEDSYAFDEYNGYLRVSSSDYNFDLDEDVSSIYVLSSSLDVIGRLCDIAKDEQIKSVRYMGKYGYVVTFKNTDPLFVVDFSDPSKPEIKGQLKLPGFSEYLHPISESLLIGVGYDGDEDDANLQNVKISLFDISNPLEPKVVDTHIIKNASTDVNFDAKAFLYYEKENIIGIPLEYRITDINGDYRYTSYQYKLMKIENGKLCEKKNFSHESENVTWYEFFKGAYIGKTLYTVTDLSVYSFDMNSGEKTGFVEFATRGE